MKILVTGATGFIGRHLARCLVVEGHSVRALVRRDDPSLSGDGVELVVGDITAPAAVAAAVQATDAVFHLAAQRDQWGIAAPVYRHVNVQGTQLLLEAAAQAGVKRFVYCSSVGVARHPGNLMADENLPYNRPTSQVAYHLTKAQAEREVLALARVGRVPALVVRPVIAYGPGDYTGMVTKLLDRLARGRFLLVGNGLNHIDLVYVDDLVRGMVLSLERATPGAVYILSGPRPTMVRELLAEASAALGKPRPGRAYLPVGLARGLAACAELAWSAAGRQPPISRDAIATLTVDRGFSHARACAELGYRPTVGYPEGLARTVAWARSAGLVASVG